MRIIRIKRVLIILITLMFVKGDKNRRCFYPLTNTNLMCFIIFATGNNCIHVNEIIHSGGQVLVLPSSH